MSYDDFETMDETEAGDLGKKILLTTALVAIAGTSYLIGRDHGSADETHDFLNQTTGCESVESNLEEDD